MATYLRRFANVGILKSIAPRNLIALLKPHAPYLSSRGLQLPQSVAVDGLDYDRLVEVLMTPSPDAPRLLLDALYLVDELATPEGMEQLLQEAENGRILIDGGADHTAADVAVQAFLQNKDLLERKHAEQYLTRRRSFEHFQTASRRPRTLRPPSAQVLSALASDLDDWYEKKKRSRGSRVLVFPKDDGIWFLVCHGDAVKREGSIVDGQSSSVVYRPEVFDVLVYDPHLGELRMSACGRSEKELFRREFGRHLFDAENHFPGTAKYTLEPLRTDGEASLVCTDVDGLEWVRLTEVQFLWGGTHGHVEIRRAKDVFAVFTAIKRSMPAKARISQARFQVKFADSKTARTVVIRPSNIAQYTRDSDAAIVEDWLTKRGFISAGRDDETE